MKQLILSVVMTLVGLAQSTTRPVVLAWQPSTPPAPNGYNLYKSNITGGPYTKVNPTPVLGLSFTDPGETIGSSVFYVVTALNVACVVPPVGPCGESDPTGEAALINVPSRGAKPGQLLIVVP